MPHLATNARAGEYGVPGLGVVHGGETVKVSPEMAIYLRTLPEFDVVAIEPLDDLPFRDESDTPRYFGYMGPVDSRFGYGCGGITILRAMTLLGVQVSVNPTYGRGRQYSIAYPVDLPEDAASQLVKRTFIPRWELAQCLPDEYPFSRLSRRIGFSMWEMDRIPDGSRYSEGAPFGDWAAQINEHCERLVVPCRHNAEVFESCGVRVPITTIPYGLDTEHWPYFNRPERDLFTVVLFGDLTSRKGPLEAVRAFQRAFPQSQYDDVRLILKSQHMHFGAGSAVPVLSDGRVSFINDTWTRPQLLEFVNQADCFIWPSRGEGFGLPPLQALLTGCPVLTTTHTGMQEWFNPKYAHAIQDAGTSEAPLYGNWIDPDVDSAVDGLRYIYENRTAALRKAKAGAAYVRREFSLSSFAQRIAAYMETLE